MQAGKGTNTTNSSLYDDRARASQLPQYDDITLRNLEVININAAMRNSLVMGDGNEILFTNLKRFHLYFGGLYDATYLETTMAGEAKEKVKGFLDNPLVKSLQGTLSNTANRSILQDSTKLALQVFDIYEQAMQKAGYRKTTYQSLKTHEKWRENI